jgi:hypothetical protein
MAGTLKVPSQFPLGTEGLSAELRQFPQFPHFFTFSRKYFSLYLLLLLIKGKKSKTRGIDSVLLTVPQFPMGTDWEPSRYLPSVPQGIEVI